MYFLWETYFEHHLISVSHKEYIKRIFWAKHLPWFLKKICKIFFISILGLQGGGKLYTTLVSEIFEEKCTKKVYTFYTLANFLPKLYTLANFLPKVYTFAIFG